MHPLHQAAREYAARGIPVFPCEPGSKQPRAGGHGFHDATTDEATIRQWWAEKDYNVAFSPHTRGLGVVDLDGAAGIENWELAQIEHGQAPQTYTVQTPHGLHLYFEGEVPGTQSILGKHVDTRGRGSYALLPPSVLADGGQYVVVDDRDPAPMPDWIMPLIDRVRTKAKAAYDELDQPGNVTRAERYLRTAAPAVSGEGGNKQTYVVACDTLNLGLTPETTFKLMADIYNPRCEPPWDDAELETLIANAASYAQNEAGAWAAPPASEVFGSVLDTLDLDDDTPEEPKPKRFEPRTLEQIAALPPPSWLIPELMPAGGLTMFYGPGGSYKSFIVLAHALALAKEGHEVVYVAGEGSRGLEPRAAAWKLANDVDGSLPLHIVGEMPWAQDLGQVGELIDAIRAKSLNPDLVVIDTVARAMIGLDENNAKDMGQFVAAMEMIQRTLHCAVAVVHHTGKDEGRGARGSVALSYAVDAAHEVIANKETRAVAVRCRRMKDADERERPWLYEMRQIGPSIVPMPIDAKAYKVLTPQDEKAQVKAIVAALTQFKEPVTTHVLASVLLPASPDESPEEREENIVRCSRVLRSRSTLPAYAPYVEGKGQDMTWGLPS